MRRLFKVSNDRHGSGKVTFAWHPDGNFLASAGKNGMVNITDRHGDIVDEVRMASSNNIVGLAWDKDGEFLSILQDNNGVVPLWNLSSRKVVPLETNLKDPTFFAWSKEGPQLAIGTAKGNLLIYNKVKKQKIPVVGKHSKKIVCGSWSATGNKLALGAEDCSLTISNEAGDTLVHQELTDVPTEALFPEQRTNSFDDNIITMNLGGSRILLQNIMDEREDPMELTFARKENGKGCKYGDIIHHERLDDNSLIVGFSLGYLQVVSTSPKDIGTEKDGGKFHQSMSGFAVNKHMKRVATIGKDGVRIINLRDFKEVREDYIPREDLEHGEIVGLDWSPDGQILTVSTNTGNVYNFLAKMSVLYARHKTMVAYLSSLREVSIKDATRSEKSRPIEVSLKLEPSIIALGPRHIAAGMNNKVYYHSFAADIEPYVVNEMEYTGTVKEIQLNNNYAVVVVGDKAHVHPIESSKNDRDDGRKPMVLPNRKEGAFSKLKCISVAGDFLYYGTEAGTIEVFYMDDWTLLPALEFRLDDPIKALYSNMIGTLLVVVDASNRLFLFNPVSNKSGMSSTSLIQFEETPATVVSVLWDVVEKNTILVFDGTFIHTYIYVESSMKGSLLTKLGPVTVSSEGHIELYPDKVETYGGEIPILSANGVLTCQGMKGDVATVYHPYFDKLQGKKRRHEEDDEETIQSKFCQALALLKLEEAWEAALQLDRRQFWLALSGKAMELLNVEVACRVYKQLGDGGMVMALQELTLVEDKDLLAGHISLLFCDYKRAQELFLESSRPSSALEMRKDLMQWDHALTLAETLSKPQLPEIYVLHGEQLESRGQTQDAMTMFENALQCEDENGRQLCPEHLVRTAEMGIARCNLRMGNIGQGIRYANEMDDQQLYEDAGDLLEQQKQYHEAVKMFVKCNLLERAAFIYTKHIIVSDKSRIQEAADIMEKIHNDQINGAFAKACVGMKQYAIAARAYMRAKDIDKVIELKLRYLDETQEAFDLVRQGASAQGAALVADYCQERDDYRGAIEFLLMAGKSGDAFELAQQKELVEVYTDFLGDLIGSEEAQRVAIFYERTQDLGKAGKFYSYCGQYSKALELFLQCGDKEIDAAIEVVGKSQDESLTNDLIDFLVGDKDGVPKNPNYIYRLYMALKKYEDAAKTALIIARQEQDMGNFPIAHEVIVETIRCLEEANIKVSAQLRQQFVLLHSYLLSKKLIRGEDHIGAARLLLRVATNVSKFPTHLAKILAATVVQCQRSGLKASAYEYARQLMRPENRGKIDDDNIKRRIEAIVRRSKSEKEEVPEDQSPCPISGEMIGATVLECPTTKDQIPMCVVTGRHMTIDDWCFCPVSKYPALASEYKRYISRELDKARDAGKPEEALDPVTNKPVSVSDISMVGPDEAMEYIKKYNGVIEKKEAPEEDGDDAAEKKEASPPKVSKGRSRRR